MSLTDQEIINKYRSKLRAANVLESQDPHYATEKLQECVELLGQLENPTPKHQKDKIILEKRILRLHPKKIPSEIDRVETKEIEEITEEVEEIEKEQEVETKEQEVNEVKEEEQEVEAKDQDVNEVKEEEQEVEAKDQDVDEVKEEEHEIGNLKENEQELNDVQVQGEVEALGEQTVPPLPSSEQFEIPYHAKVIPILPDIFEEIYSGLLENRSLEYQEYLTFYQSINDIFTDPLPPIIYQESNVAFYIGDTHGAFSETQTIVRYFERILTQPTSKSIRIIFLGDYVDRNPHDLENLTLIIAFWLKFPENVIILRGNHEDSKINQYYGFINNLTDTFVIEEWVRNLYQEILNMFVKLPVAHVGTLYYPSNMAGIRVFSAHGGIPIDSDNPTVPVKLIDLYNEIEATSTTFEEFDKYMNWLLWADPKEGGEKDVILRPDTGRNQFGLTPFNQFMELNNLQFMVRAHEVLQEGYKYFFDQRLISLFTASTYKNRPIGKAAFIRLEADKSPVILSTDSDMLDMDFDYWANTLLPSEI